VNLVGVAARVALGGVFLFSGVSKLRDAAWPAVAARFGLPLVLAWPLAYGEVGLGALLVAQVAPPWPSFAALALLAVFTGAAAAHAARHDDVPCGCFGSASSARPTTWRTVARNVALCALALAATL
jgi:uncharacterized membrane protein YphA (DoxX/SURF4 family)